MKVRKWIALALVCGIPALALAQSVVQDGQPLRGTMQGSIPGTLNRADSTFWMNSGDGTGNAYTTEANPDRTFLYKYQSIIQNSLWRVQQYQAAPTTATQVLPQADSSSARVTLGASHMALLISYTLDDSTCAALLKVEVRGHLTQNVDSVSTFRWRWRAAGVSPVDTIGANTTANTGSVVSTFVTSAVDTSNVGVYETGVWLNMTGPYRAIYLPIVNRDTGDWFSAPYTSVRVCIVKAYGTTACTAYLGKTGARTSVNVDLVGWR